MAAVLERLASLERHNARLETQLIEQEHRWFGVWRNWFRYRNRPTDREASGWPEKRAASRWALLWRFVSPEGAAAGTVGFMAVFGAVMAWQANALLSGQNALFRAQNAKFDAQNALVAKQNEHFQEQTSHLVQQFAVQAEEAYQARRASLVGTLYDRKDNCLRSEKQCPGARPCTVGKVCPHRASRRAREDALRALVSIERERNPLPVQSGPAPARLALNELVLRDAALRGVDLAHADLNGADFRGADLRSANLTGAHVLRANLSGADLRGTVLVGTNLGSADLTIANLGHADLHGAHVNSANLSRADLSVANLSDASLVAANLQDARLFRARLGGADLYGTDLRGADLIGADLLRAKVGVANFKDTDLTGADFTGSRNLTQPQLDLACGYRGGADHSHYHRFTRYAGLRATRLPRGLTIKPCSPEFMQARIWLPQGAQRPPDDTHNWP